MKYIGIFLLSVFISSVSQIILKTSANRKHEGIIREYLNSRVILAYTLFLISSFVTVIAYKYIPLSMGAILESSGYIFVTVLGVVFLQEKVGKRRLLGLFIIMVGIFVFYL